MEISDSNDPDSPKAFSLSSLRLAKTRFPRWCSSLELERNWHRVQTSIRIYQLALSRSPIDRSPVVFGEQIATRLNNHEALPDSAQFEEKQREGHGAGP